MAALFGAGPAWGADRMHAGKRGRELEGCVFLGGGDCARCCIVVVIRRHPLVLQSEADTEVFS